MKILLNIIYYSLFNFFVSFSKFVHLTSYPLKYIYLVPGINRFYKKENVEWSYKKTKKFLIDPKDSLSKFNATIACNFLVALVIMVSFRLIHLYIFEFTYLTELSKRNDSLKILIAIILLFPALFFTEILITRNNKYLDYFRYFESQSKLVKFSYYLLTFFTYSIVSLVNIYFYFYIKN